MMGARDHTFRGFTIVEVILVILIVSLLIALVAPTLTGTFAHARRSASLANIRTHVSTMLAYSGDHAETFPYLTDPRATYSVLRCGESARRVEYFHVAFQWHFGLADLSYGGDCASRSFWPPGMRPNYSTAYYYSATFIASPEFWNARTRTGPVQWRAIRQSEVLFPSLKGMIWNRAAFPGLTPDYAAGVPEVGFVDGSARLVDAASFLPPYRGGEGPYPSAYFSGQGVPVHHTIDGVRGRDVK